MIFFCFFHKKQTVMGHPWVVASSAFFFLPALISFFRQNVVVTIIFFNAALFSTLYHVHDQDQYAELDVLWASLAVLTALTLLAVIAQHYAPWNWRVILPFLLGLTAFVLYFVGGQISETEEAEKRDDYELYHSLWHLFVGLAGLVLAWTPVNLAEANLSYKDLYSKIVKGYSTTEVTERTLLQ
jgi:predicted membrane channel-forming protein YqfA (hemolysin III family)